MRILGLDIGDSRIGVALSDPQGILASPVTIINRTGGKSDTGAITDIARQNQVERIIVGLPLSMNGSLSKQAEKVKNFIAELCRETEVPVEFRDERLSTVSVKRMVRGFKKTDRGTRYDAMAAALILQSYLDEALQKKEEQNIDGDEPE